MLCKSIGSLWKRFTLLYNNIWKPDIIIQIFQFNIMKTVFVCYGYLVLSKPLRTLYDNILRREPVVHILVLLLLWLVLCVSKDQLCLSSAKTSRTCFNFQSECEDHHLASYLDLHAEVQNRISNIIDLMGSGKYVDGIFIDM